MSASSLNHCLLSIARDALLAAGIIDINEPEASINERMDGRFLRVTLGSGTPALIYTSRCYRDEWIVSIAVRPKADAKQYMSTSAAGSLVGEAFAWGWMNRWQYNRRRVGIERFSDACAYVASHYRPTLAAILSNDAIAA